MDDYLSEKEQWEAVKAGVREYGGWIIAGIAVGAAVLGGYRWYQDHRDHVGAEASQKYAQVAAAFERNDRTQALTLLGELERDYSSSPYVDQAHLLAARSYVAGGELDQAAKDLQSVASNSKDADLALIARMRLARVQIAEKKADDALTTLNGAKPGAFAPEYYEVMGDAYYAKGNKSEALKNYTMARASDLGSFASNPQLDLKITDLAVENTPLASDTPHAK
ncbi:MAG TPA: tetratricopeptide repeat protein [Steroidobacteraceae bacterium]|nr:tetratricopeptide repeat protein [Steroidobacteraceae bacterium]